MIDIKKLKSLISLMAENDISEMDLEGEGEKVRLRRGPLGEVQYVQPGQMPAQMPPPGQTPPPSPQTPPTGDAPSEATDIGNARTIDSPMVGTFYLSPTPDADAFVNVGDSVDSQTVVCIVEAMKVFNEIKAETTGTIGEVLVENGQPVEYGQALFRLS